MSSERQQQRTEKGTNQIGKGLSNIEGIRRRNVRRWFKMNLNLSEVKIQMKEIVGGPKERVHCEGAQSTRESIFSRIPI